MKAINYALCSKPECSHLATVINGEEFHRCLHHLQQDDKTRIIELIQKVNDELAARQDQFPDTLRSSVFDGRDDEGMPSHRLPCALPKGSDLRGSVFVAVDFSSGDFDEVDFSYSHFLGCDLRRTKLHNVSLRMTWFSRCLVRQANIDHSDVRWMISCVPEFERQQGIAELLLEPMARRKSAAIDSRLRIVPKEERPLFFRYLGLDVEQEDEISCSDEECIKIIKEIYNESEAGKADKLPDILKWQVGFELETDWSGSTFRDSDLAYARFDNAIAHEVVFDGSDLHCATFAYAQLSRSSFVNVSFSRINGSPDNAANETSRFLGAIMDGCILKDANLDSVFFEKTCMSSARLAGARLAGAVFFDCDLKNITGDDIEADNAWFLSSNLSGSSLHGALLRSAKFWWQEKESRPRCLPEQVATRIFDIWTKYGELLKTTNITGVNIQAGDLHNADLSCVNLSGSLLQGADLTLANFTEAVCVGTQLVATNITGTNFSKANLNSADFSDSGSNSLECPPKFNGANLEDATLSNMDLSCVDFVDLASMEGVDLSNCRLNNAKFRSTSPDHKANIRRSTFRTSRIDGTYFENVDLRASDMSFCISESENSSIFDGCNLRVASFRSLKIKIVEWKHCDLQKADISDSEINEAYFLDKCNLESATFADSTVKFIKINEPASISLLNLNGAKIGDEEYERSVIIGSIAIESMKPYSGLIFDNSDFINCCFYNIGINSSSFKYMEFENVDFENTYISFCDFSSSAIYFRSIKYCNFIYNDFSKSLIKNNNDLIGTELHEDTSVFLGCNFNESTLLPIPKGIIFADCKFNYSSFMTPEAVKGWSEALLIQCVFSQKYHGIKEIGSDIIVDLLQDNCMSIKEFVEKYRLNINSYDTKSRFDAILRRRLSLHPPFTVWTRRLKDLIPGEKLDNNKYSYAAAYELCREFRKDLFNIGLTETASIVYVMERKYYQKSISCFDFSVLGKWLIKTGRLFNTAGELIIEHDKNNVVSKINSIVNNKMIDAFKTSNIFPHALLCFYTLIFLILGHWKSFFSIIAPSLIVLLGTNRKGKLILSEHLYDYGENVGKMLWSAVGCILAFAILYYGFVPNRHLLDETMKNNTTISRECKDGDTYKTICFAPASSYCKQLDIPSDNTESGYLVEGAGVLNKQKRIDLNAFLTCLYFSGVTFTTLGYGDIQPVGIVRILAIMEAGIGAFLMALFVFSFTRRNAQR